MGDKKKFTHPVLVKMRNNPDVYQMGFITQNDLSKLNLNEKVAVYLPHSYAVSGVLVFVDKDNITPVKMNPADAMKMVVSGGVTGYDDDENDEINSSSNLVHE